MVKIVDKPNRLEVDLEKLKQRKDEAAKEEIRKIEDRRRKTFYGGQNPLD